MSDWKNVQYKDGKYKTSSGGGGGGASALADLDDVNITSATDGQVLKYDAQNDKWANANDGGSSSHNYSTTEQVIGTWIDGKPLYEKCVEVSNLVSGDNTIQHGISNFKKLITATGYIATTNDSDYNPIPCISSVAGWSARVRDFNSATFVFEIGSGIVTYYTKGTIILQYTKTTD